MRAIRSTLVSLLLLLASTARAQTQPWTSMPLSDFGIAPAEAALLAALPPVPDLLAPLWDSTSALDLVTAALGPPDEVNGIESRWAFATLRVEVQDRNSHSIIEIKPRRTPNPALRVHSVVAGCDTRMSTLCTPESLDRLSLSTRHLFDKAFIRVLVKKLHAAQEAAAQPRR